MRFLSLLGRRLPRAGENGNWMAVLTDHGIHGMAGICPLFNSLLGLSTFGYPLGISPSLAVKDMSLPLIGGREPCTLSYKYVRRAVISRSCIRGSLPSLVD